MESAELITKIYCHFLSQMSKYYRSYHSGHDSAKASATMPS